MGNRWHKLLMISCVVALSSQTAWAGMFAPVTITEIGRMRLEAISFFLAVLLVSAGLIKWLWNGLRTSFTRLPRLTYWRAVGLVILWGLLFMVVLLMVASARELMTPGAWERNGAIYKVIEGAK